MSFVGQKLRKKVRLLVRRRTGLLPRQLANVPVLDFFARPRGLAQKREAGFHRGIELKAPDGNAPPHLIPAMALNQLVDDGFQSDAVQRITGMVWHRPQRSKPGADRARDNRFRSVLIPLAV